MNRCSPALLPDTALLARYATNGSYTDCFEIQMEGRVALSEFLQAFYTTPLFKTERVILALAGHPSTDEQARALAEGGRCTFAAWTVEDRSDGELLMCDTSGKTRSWFSAATDANAKSTRLCFGSAVVAKAPASPGDAPKLGLVFRLLLGAHRRYSVELLNAAYRALARARR